MKEFKRPRNKRLLPALIFFLAAVLLMYTVADSVRDSYSKPGEPKNAYMVHMFERGMNYEQVYCTSTGKCAELASPGMTGLPIPSFQIGEDYYFGTLQQPGFEEVQARGIYCPGAIDIHRCVKLTVLTEGESCSAEIEYFGLRAFLVEDSCLETK